MNTADDLLCDFDIAPVLEHYPNEEAWPIIINSKLPLRQEKHDEFVRLLVGPDFQNGQNAVDRRPTDGIIYLLNSFTTNPLENFKQRSKIFLY